MYCSTIASDVDSRTGSYLIFLIIPPQPYALSQRRYFEFARSIGFTLRNCRSKHLICKYDISLKVGNQREQKLICLLLICTNVYKFIASIKLCYFPFR